MYIINMILGFFLIYWTDLNDYSNAWLLHERFVI